MMTQGEIWGGTGQRRFPVVGRWLEPSSPPVEPRSKLARLFLNEGDPALLGGFSFRRRPPGIGHQRLLAGVLRCAWQLSGTLRLDHAGIECPRVRGAVIDMQRQVGLVDGIDCLVEEADRRCQVRCALEDAERSALQDTLIEGKGDPGTFLGRSFASQISPLQSTVCGSRRDFHPQSPAEHLRPLTVVRRCPKQQTNLSGSNRPIGTTALRVWLFCETRKKRVCSEGS